MIKEIFNLMDFDGNGEIGDDEILELDEMVYFFFVEINSYL